MVNRLEEIRKMEKFRVRLGLSRINPVEFGDEHILETDSFLGGPQ